MRNIYDREVSTLNDASGIHQIKKKFQNALSTAFDRNKLDTKLTALNSLYNKATQEMKKLDQAKEKWKNILTCNHAYYDTLEDEFYAFQYHEGQNIELKLENNQIFLCYQDGDLSHVQVIDHQPLTKITLKKCTR